VDLARSIAIPEPALGMAERFDLEGRVHSLLDPGQRRTVVSRRLCVAMFIGALAVMVPLAAVRAQVARASIGGTVYDPSGAVVPGASISLKSTGGSNEESGRGNEAGVFKLQVPAGEYLVKVTVPGFAMYQSKIMLDPGVPATMNVNLSLGEVSESLEIVGKGPQSPARSAGSPQKIRVGGMVQHIKLISKVDPVYPADAQAEGVEGTVVLRGVVSKDGRLLSVKVVSGGDPRLATAAVNAVRVWQYQPALLNGEPVEVITTIALAFRLN
jgi:TonB family protein